MLLVFMNFCFVIIFVGWGFFKGKTKLSKILNFSREYFTAQGSGRAVSSEGTFSVPLMRAASPHGSCAEPQAGFPKPTSPPNAGRGLCAVGCSGGQRDTLRALGHPPQEERSQVGGTNVRDVWGHL